MTRDVGTQIPQPPSLFDAVDTEEVLYGWRDSERWIHRVAGPELHRLYGHTMPYPTCGDSMCVRARRHLQLANAESPVLLIDAVRGE